MSDRKKEYDEFGPWIIKIKGEDDVPGQYEQYTRQILSGSIAFKIPVNVDRREIEEGMLLYDTVVSIDGSKLRLYIGTESGCEEKETDIRNITYIQCMINMLTGRLILGTTNEIIEFNFNPVGREIVEEAISTLRKKYVTDFMQIDLEKLDEKVHVDSFLYQTLLSQAKKKENVKVVEYQPFVELENRKSADLRKSKEALDEPVLQDSLFLTNGKEVLIMNRLKEVKEETEADYGYLNTYIPLEYISNISTVKDEKLEHLQNLIFKVKGSKVIFKVSSDFSVEILEKTLDII